MTETADIGIIGGTGVYDQDSFEDVKEIKVFTPFGETSDLISVGVYKNVKVAFIPRHGKNHTIPPHRVNYRANVWALKHRLSQTGFQNFFSNGFSQFAALF